MFRVNFVQVFSENGKQEEKIVQRTKLYVLLWPTRRCVTISHICNIFHEIFLTFNFSYRMLFCCCLRDHGCPFFLKRRQIYLTWSRCSWCHCELDFSLRMNLINEKFLWNFSVHTLHAICARNTSSNYTLYVHIMILSRLNIPLKWYLYG